MVYDPTTLIPQVSVIAEPNPLFKFASYNYLFTLSALTEKEIRNQVSLSNSKPKNIISRSGGIGAGTPEENSFERANE